MKKINVIVKDKTILELAEDGLKGDLIDLKELAEVDVSYIETIVDSGKDKVYESKLNEIKRIINAENQLKIQELNAQIDAIQKANASNLVLKENEIEKKYIEIISDLKKQIELLKKDSQNALNVKEQEVEKKYIESINDLKNQLEVLTANKTSEIEAIKSKNQLEMNKIVQEDERKFSELENKYNLLFSEFEMKIKQSKLELENKYTVQINKLQADQTIANEKKIAEIEALKVQYEHEKDKLVIELKEKFDAELKLKEEMINNLQRAKASMNVKQTGEDLETWCDNEVTAYMQNGLFNCTWIKDNKVVKDDSDTKGSKADYIFKVYAGNDHLDNELLASVCLEMKDENPDSTTKQTNAHYYKKLEENRVKKNCKYAVLVSNLEMDKPNTLPIFKVREYENMYVVRPAYLMVFLNMITSLTTRFSDLVLSKEVEMIELKTKINLIDEFNSIKTTYLDKPLESLEKSVEAIIKSSEAIKKASKDIDDQCDKINRSYIQIIVDKLTKYELKLNRSIIKKLD